MKARSAGGRRRPGEGAGGGHPSRPVSSPIGVWGSAPKAIAFCVENYAKKARPVKIKAVPQLYCLIVYNESNSD